MAAHTSRAGERGVAIVPGLALVGFGFALAISSSTAAAVNAVPDGLEGMASGATNTLRDFGFTLGPAVVGVVALGRATSNINARVAASPKLHQALQASMPRRRMLRPPSRQR